MKTETEPIWYAFSGTHYSGKFPAFFSDVETDGFRSIVKERVTIKQELKHFLNEKRNSLPSYFNKSLIQGEGNWDVLHFIRWGERIDNNLTAFPRTAALLQRIPGVTSAAITRLAPHTTILPHEGDTNAVIRCHLGLQIPADLPDCGMEVNSELISWSEDKWFFFCDAHKHSAWNNSGHDRIVLIVDIIHPMFIEHLNAVCNNVRSALDLQRAEGRFPIFKKLPGRIRGLLRRCFLILHYLRYKNEY